MKSHQSAEYAARAKTLLRDIARPFVTDDERTAYAVPAAHVEHCVCGARIHGAEREHGQCLLCRKGTHSEFRYAAIPPKYRWARLDRQIRPSGWPEDRLLIPESIRRKCLLWADGKLDGPKDALTISCERDGGSITGSGKTSLASAVARYVAEKRGLTITWVHASELRGDHDDRDVPPAAMKRLLNAKLSVLDGIGKELGGAQDVKGWQPARIAKMLEYSALMYEQARGIRIVTNDLPRYVLVQTHGPDFVRRFGQVHPVTKKDENATLIEL